jgi:hypothetical protein
MNLFQRLLRRLCSSWPFGSFWRIPLVGEIHFWRWHDDWSFCFDCWREGDTWFVRIGKAEIVWSSWSFDRFWQSRKIGDVRLSRCLWSKRDSDWHFAIDRIEGVWYLRLGYRVSGYFASRWVLLSEAFAERRQRSLRNMTVAEWRQSVS